MKSNDHSNPFERIHVNVMTRLTDDASDPSEQLEGLRPDPSSASERSHHFEPELVQ
jgi:hypothetical protein